MVVGMIPLYVCSIFTLWDGPRNGRCLVYSFTQSGTLALKPDIWRKLSLAFPGAMAMFPLLTRQVFVQGVIIGLD